MVLPRLARAKLHLQPGAKLKCEVHGDSIVLSPQAPRKRKTLLVVDPITGLCVTKSTSSEPFVTSDMVKALLADFP